MDTKLESKFKNEFNRVWLTSKKVQIRIQIRVQPYNLLTHFRIKKLGWVESCTQSQKLGRVGSGLPSGSKFGSNSGRVGWFHLTALLKTPLTIVFWQICEKIWSSQVFTYFISNPDGRLCALLCEWQPLKKSIDNSAFSTFPLIQYKIQFPLSKSCHQLSILQHTRNAHWY